MVDKGGAMGGLVGRGTWMDGGGVGLEVGEEEEPDKEDEEPDREDEEWGDCDGDGDDDTTGSRSRSMSEVLLVSEVMEADTEDEGEEGEERGDVEERERGEGVETSIAGL